MAIQPRPEVCAYAEAIQRLLDEHQDEKGDAWKNDDAHALIVSTYRACDRLRNVVDLHKSADGTLLQSVRIAAASVGAHAMFVADVCGALRKEETP